MAEYRTIKMSFWTDPYVEALPTDGKLLYLYLFTCPLTNNLGVLETTVKRIAYDTDIDARRVSSLLSEMENGGKIIRDGNFIWLANFIKNQCSTSPKLLQSMKEILQELPSQKIRHAICLRYPHIFECKQEDMQASDTVSDNQNNKDIPYQYPTDTVSIPSGEYGIGNMEDGIGIGNGEDINARAQEKKSKPEKKAYGEFQNVMLTDDEYEKLCSHFGNSYYAGQWIGRLDEYIASKGAKYKNHYATILNWERKANDASHVPRPTTVAQQRQQERQVMAQMLLADGDRKRAEEKRDANGNRIVTNADGTQLTLPPGW